MSKPATVRLDLRPEPGWHGDEDRRLAMALKALLRSYGWRCVSVGPLPQERGLPDVNDDAAPPDAVPT